MSKVIECKAVTQKEDSFDFPIDFMMQGMFVVIMVMVLLPMLPVVQSAQRYFESQRYEGTSDPRTLNATQTLQHIVLANPWIGAYFINDSPNEVEIRLNDEEGTPFLITPGETITLNRAGARDRIYAVYYNCRPGETATVRVIGEW